MNIVLYLLFLTIGSLAVIAPQPDNTGFLSAFFLIFMTLPLWLDLFSFDKKRAALVILGLGLFGLTFEHMAITTGWPYGNFTYSSAIGGKIGGEVPWTVGIAWPPIIILSTLFANTFTQKTTFYKLLLALFAVIIFDAILDPAAVAINYWSWENSGIYYGIPLTNYLGWLISGAIGVVFAHLALRDHRLTNQALNSGFMMLGFWTGVCISTSLYFPALLAALLAFALFKRV
jgi:putative membrane protein